MKILFQCLLVFGCVSTPSSAFVPAPSYFSRYIHDTCLSSVPTERDSGVKPMAWVVSEGVSFGSLGKLKFLPQEKKLNATSSSSRCTISTRAIGLNFADIFCILGLYSAANEIRGTSSFCPGLEYAGIVKDDPTGTYAPGDRVLGFTRFGAYADTVEVPPYYLYPLPSNWSFAQGASFLVQALTAWHGMVEVGQLPDWKSSLSEDGKDHIVLVHSAAGGVGLWASEIAARRGAIVIGLGGSELKAETFEQRILPLSPRSRFMVRGDEGSFGQRLGHVLAEIHNVPEESKPSKDLLAALRKQGHGVDMVMESLGGKYFTESFEALNRGGSLVTFGSTSYVSPGLGINTFRLIWRYLTRPRIDPGTLTSRNIRLAGFNLIYLTDLPETLRRELRECIICLSGLSPSNCSDEELVPLSGVTPPIVGDTFDFRTETVSALEHLKGGTTVGKVVLRND